MVILEEECVRVFVTTHWCSTFFLAHTFKYSEKTMSTLVNMLSQALFILEHGSLPMMTGWI